MIGAPQQRPKGDKTGARFLTPLVLKADAVAGYWILNSDLIYLSKDLRAHRVPKGFRTDLASIPRFFRRFITVNGKHRPAAVVHDFYYQSRFRGVQRSAADALFYEAMIACGVSKWKASLMYSAVRIGGGLFWEKD